MRALLDVSVLLPLFDSGHIHHRPAVAWCAANAKAGWASCPLTQNSFVRIVCQPKYPRAARMLDALAVLRRQIGEGDHALAGRCLHHRRDAVLPSVHPRTAPGKTRVPIRLPMSYLLRLAVRHGGRLVTFDRGMSVQAVRGAEARHLVVL